MRNNRTAIRWVCLFIFVSLSFAALFPQLKPSTHGRSGPVQVQMRNVMYHYTDKVAVHIRLLGGELLSTHDGQFPVFDDKNSFTLKIAAGEMAMSPDSLANVLNSYVFARQDAPLKDLSITIEGDHLKVKGKLHNKGDIGFEEQGRLSATPEGKIRLHAEKIHALHLPVKGMMDLFGLDIANLIKTGKVRGVEVDKDDMIFDPQQILPPPHIQGQITSIRLEKNNIVQVFGDPQKHRWESNPAQNYMAYRGNKLQFGKLIMIDTDMIIIDMEPKDAFDFFLDHYRDQLAAGYTKTTKEFGLRVFMRDYNKLEPKNKRSAGLTQHANPYR